MHGAFPKLDELSFTVTRLGQRGEAAAAASASASASAPRVRDTSTPQVVSIWFKTYGVSRGRKATHAFNSNLSTSKSPEAESGAGAEAEVHIVQDSISYSHYSVSRPISQAIFSHVASPYLTKVRIYWWTTMDFSGDKRNVTTLAITVLLRIVSRRIT